jgi:hypothetical protein
LADRFPEDASPPLRSSRSWGLLLFWFSGDFATMVSRRLFLMLFGRLFINWLFFLFGYHGSRTTGTSKPFDFLYPAGNVRQLFVGGIDDEVLLFSSGLLIQIVEPCLHLVGSGVPPSTFYFLGMA